MQMIITLGIIPHKPWLPASCQAATTEARVGRLPAVRSRTRVPWLPRRGQRCRGEPAVGRRVSDGASHGAMET